MDTEIGCYPYRLQHGQSLVGFTDPGAVLVTVIGCCHFSAQLGEFFQVFSTNHDWVVHSSVLPQNFSLLCVDFENNSVGCFPKTFSFLLGILVFAR